MTAGPKLSYFALSQYITLRRMPFLCICAKPWGVPVRVNTFIPWYSITANDSQCPPEPPAAA